MTWTEFRLTNPAARLQPIAAAHQADTTTVIIRRIPVCACSQPEAAAQHIATCDEEAIAERCPCLRLDAYYPIAAPSLASHALDRGETFITGARTNTTSQE